MPRLTNVNVIRLHTTLFDFFVSLAFDRHTRQYIQVPYLHTDGKQIIAAPLGTQSLPNAHHFTSLADAINVIKIHANDPANLSSPTKENLIALIRFFNALTVCPISRSLMQAPVYRATPSQGLYDFRSLVKQQLYAGDIDILPNINNKTLVSANIIFDAMQTLAASLPNLPALNQYLQTLLDSDNLSFDYIGLQALTGLPPTTQQMAIWLQLLVTFLPQDEDGFFSMKNLLAILFDRHFQWEIVGLMLAVLLEMSLPDFDPAYFITLRIMWDIIGMQLFSNNGTIIVSPTLAYTQAFFVTGIAMHSLSSPLDKQICHSALGAIKCGALSRAKIVTTIIAPIPPLLSWFNKPAVQRMNIRPSTIPVARRIAAIPAVEQEIDQRRTPGRPHFN